MEEDMNKILSFDAETNGLWGTSFAIGAAAGAGASPPGVAGRRTGATARPTTGTTTSGSGSFLKENRIKEK